MYQVSVRREERFEHVGGLRIFVRSWRPDEKARGVVIIVPGFNSHSGQYRWVAEQFASNGLAVYAVDLRGRGKSDGERFYVEKVSDYIKDVEAVAALAKSREAGLPVFLMGHSAGGVISCVYALQHQSELTGLICESFAYRVPAPAFALAIIKKLSHVTPHLHVLRLDNKGFSRDPRAVEALQSDPFITNEVQPTQTVAAMLGANERLTREFPLITLPLFILHGTADKVTKPDGSQFFYDTAGSNDKTLKLYEGHVHDPLNDIEREAVMTDIQRWIDARLPAAKFEPPESGDAGKAAENCGLATTP